MRHVLVMTGAGAVGLVAIFLVDALSLLYVSRLGDADLTAAVGFATQVMFLGVGVNIGLSIAVTALVSRALGAGDRDRARRLAGSGLALAGLFSGLVVVLLWLARGEILRWLGASGESADVARGFLGLALPANLMLGLAMALMGVLRAHGEARRSMYVTLAGAAATAVLDPVLIFGLGLGVDGAAIATLAARALALAVGWRFAVGRGHVAAPRLADLGAHFAPLAAIAGPAILTNLASPVAVSWVLAALSAYGPEAVAAFAIVDRVAALGFAAIFALSGSIGAILGQNLGARRIGRVGRAMAICFRLSTGYAVIVAALLWLAAPAIARAFAAPPETAALIVAFMPWAGAGWVFLCWLFVANASFNNLGFALLSTAFNWGRATLGVMPFVWLGGRYGGAEGAIAGLAAGSALFGTAAWAATGLVLRALAKRLRAA
ncbi:MAG: MATE family efflux transporter [Methylobacteriaceae bacterium]|nr:MATE family efflux transporter [Methylobacteriaceae bacterium]